MIKIKLWAMQLWNNHGSKILFSIAGAAAGWQQVILSGFVTASNTERKIIAAIILWAAAHGFGRSIGSPPKNPAP